MTSLASLKAAVQRALRLIAQTKDIQEAEVYASGTGQLLCRLSYTSEIPCHGVEEPKSSESFGLGIRAVFTGAEGPRIGFGSEARDLSPVGIRRALEKARQNAVPDPEFSAFPSPPAEAGSRARSAASVQGRHDRAIMDLKDDTLVKAGWL
ncbi:MAG: hypothetical protein FJ246_02770, partial [Nitrospira sp.]|nr:hypothetical protein [Nitrospira sp.]